MGKFVRQQVAAFGSAGCILAGFEGNVTAQRESARGDGAGGSVGGGAVVETHPGEIGAKAWLEEGAHWPGKRTTTAFQSTDSRGRFRSGKGGSVAALRLDRPLFLLFFDRLPLQSLCRHLGLRFIFFLFDRLPVDHLLRRAHRHYPVGHGVGLKLKGVIRRTDLELWLDLEPQLLRLIGLRLLNVALRARSELGPSPSKRRCDGRVLRTCPSFGRCRVRLGPAGRATAAADAAGFRLHSDQAMPARRRGRLSPRRGLRSLAPDMDREARHHWVLRTRTERRSGQMRPEVLRSRFAGVRTGRLSTDGSSRSVGTRSRGPRLLSPLRRLGAGDRRPGVGFQHKDDIGHQVCTALDPEKLAAGRPDFLSLQRCNHDRPVR